MQENVYLSTAAFMRSLLFLEASIADSYRVKITRSTEGKVYFSVHAIGSTKAAFSDNFKPDQFNSDDKRNARIGETLDKLDALHLIKPDYTEQ